jgi:hypothetical protein
VNFELLDRWVGWSWLGRRLKVGGYKMIDVSSTFWRATTHILDVFDGAKMWTTGSKRPPIFGQKSLIILHRAKKCSEYLPNDIHQKNK